jgi:hypothetical protein
LQDLPFAIVTHVRSSLRLPSDTALDVTPRTLYRHHEQIRTHLQVKTWGHEARHATILAVHQAAQVMDHPADLINVAIEDLVRQRMAKRANLHQYIRICSAMRGCGKSFALRGACQLPTNRLAGHGCSWPTSGSATTRSARQCATWNCNPLRLLCGSVPTSNSGAP